MSSVPNLAESVIALTLGVKKKAPVSTKPPDLIYLTSTKVRRPALCSGLPRPPVVCPSIITRTFLMLGISTRNNDN